MLVIGPSRSDRPKTDIPLVSVEKAVAGMLRERRLGRRTSGLHRKATAKVHKEIAADSL
jgi:hypothetical protein